MDRVNSLPRSSSPRQSFGVVRDAPNQGEHTRRGLREAGYAEGRSKRWSREGAVEARFVTARATASRRTAAAGNVADARVLRIVVARAVTHVLERHVGRVDAPEQLAAQPRSSERRRRRARSPRRFRAATPILDVGIRDPRVGVGMPSWCASSAHSIGRSGSRPSRQTKRKIRVIASRRQSHAIARRSSGIGLNGCACGNSSGMPSAFACQTTKRYVKARFAPDLGRSLLPVGVEERREHDRMRPHRRGVRLEPFALQVGERGNEIEVPVGDRRHGSIRPARGNRRATRCAAPHRQACSTPRSRRACVRSRRKARSTDRCDRR